MHPSSVIEGKPVDDLVLSLTPCFKVHIVKPLDLQRTEKSFRHCVIPTVALPAHRSAHGVTAQGRLKVAAGVLRALIGMEDQAFSRSASEPHHGQGINDEVSRYTLAHRPANHLPAEQVDDDGQVQPSSRVAIYVISPVHTRSG